jgi:hypothetical protein
MNTVSPQNMAAGRTSCDLCMGADSRGPKKAA